MKRRPRLRAFREEGILGGENSRKRKMGEIEER